MSQPVLTATVALVIATVLTVAIAVALGTKTRHRAIKLMVIGAAMLVTAVALERTGVRINLTASMPIGIYLLSPLPPDEVKRGMMVGACAPAHAAEIGRQRGYLGAGPCADDTELLLKAVAAAAGDEVDITPSGLSINGCPLPGSRPIARDISGRRLIPWPRGRYRLRSGQVWLYAGVGRSWDSRYWGPVFESSIAAIAVPVLVLRQSVEARPDAMNQGRRPDIQRGSDPRRTHQSDHAPPTQASAPSETFTAFLGRPRRPGAEPGPGMLNFGAGIGHKCLK